MTRLQPQQPTKLRPANDTDAHRVKQAERAHARPHKAWGFWQGVAAGLSAGILIGMVAMYQASMAGVGIAAEAFGQVRAIEAVRESAP